MSPSIPVDILRLKCNNSRSDCEVSVFKILNACKMAIHEIISRFKKVFFNGFLTLSSNTFLTPAKKSSFPREFDAISE